LGGLAVVIGVRGFGINCARRLGRARRLLIGDFDAAVLKAKASELAADGYDVDSSLIDVSDPASVEAFADRASGLGNLDCLLNTAGLTPRMADAERILDVNMLGTIRVMDAFLPLVGNGSVGIFIASNAAYYTPVPTEVERAFAVAPASELIAIAKRVEGWETGMGAYWLAKRCNQLRVQALAPAWGMRGGRILSVSPGIIATPGIAFERNAGSPVDDAIAAQPIRRLGLSEEIATCVEWLASRDAAYVTGTDLLIDGGMVAALRWGNLATGNPLDAG